MSSHREQFIWQRTAKLAVKCYEITKKFPKEELYGLTTHIPHPVLAHTQSDRVWGRSPETMVSIHTQKSRSSSITQWSIAKNRALGSS